MRVAKSRHDGVAGRLGGGGCTEDRARMVALIRRHLAWRVRPGCASMDRSDSGEGDLAMRRCLAQAPPMV